MKKIAEYRHPAPPTAAGPQVPDTQPGNYYVSAVDGPRYFLLLGPFPNNHAAALAAVEEVRAFANDKVPQSHFYGFGTVRMALDHDKPGSANKYLPHLLS